MQAGANGRGLVYSPSNGWQQENQFYRKYSRTRTARPFIDRKTTGTARTRCVVALEYNIRSTSTIQLPLWNKFFISVFIFNTMWSQPIQADACLSLSLAAETTPWGSREIRVGCPTSFYGEGGQKRGAMRLTGRTLPSMELSRHQTYYLQAWCLFFSTTGMGLRGFFLKARQTCESPHHRPAKIQTLLLDFSFQYRPAVRCFCLTHQNAMELTLVEVDVHY